MKSLFEQIDVYKRQVLSCLFVLFLFVLYITYMLIAIFACFFLIFGIHFVNIYLHQYAILVKYFVCFASFFYFFLILFRSYFRFFFGFKRRLLHIFQGKSFIFLRCPSFPEQRVPASFPLINHASFAGFLCF